MNYRMMQEKKEGNLGSRLKVRIPHDNLTFNDVK
jgi:hypothetical protein